MEKRVVCGILITIALGFAGWVGLTLADAPGTYATKEEVAKVDEKLEHKVEVIQQDVSQLKQDSAVNRAILEQLAERMNIKYEKPK